MKNKYRHFYLYLEERNGEYEYIHRSVHELPDGKMSTATRLAQNYAKNFYGRKAEKLDGGYCFFNGQIFIKVSRLQFITENDFKVLRNYF